MNTVCGEDCSIQVCPICAPDNVKWDVVDLILYRTMADVDPGMESLDDMLITIPQCQHAFTVETLDGHVGITNYYAQDAAGAWTGLRAPPAGFLKPPTCPTCRAPITCPRYGRIYKRADLDILENNVASHMSLSLTAIISRLDGISKPDLDAKLRSDAISPNLGTAKPTPDAKNSRHKMRLAILHESRKIPTSVSSIDPAEPLHGAPSHEARAWRSIVRDLLSAYRDAVVLASTRSSHTHAWQAAFAYL